MGAPILADAFHHHVWATLRLIDVCAELRPEQLGTTAQGTYGSILETMRHLVGADASYLFVLSDGRYPEVEEADMDLAALRAVMERDGPAWDEVIAADPDPTRTIVRQRDDGSTSSAPLGVRLAQVIHHGTDHRSQICTDLTTIGVTPPEIDVWDYADSEGRLSETPPTSQVSP